MTKPGPPDAVQLVEEHDLESFRRPMGPIPSRVQAAIDQGTRAADAWSPATLTDVAGGGDGLVDAVLRLPDGALVVACLTEMTGVSAAMWDWWFAWHSYTSERYRLWHPVDHVAAALAEDRRSVPSIRDRWLGNTSYVDEYIGGDLLRLAIRFVPPDDVGLDPAGVDELGVAVCARTGLRDFGVEGGFLVHLVEDTADGARMHSRFRLEGGLPDEAGLALLLHCAQEMNHLAGILPDLHGAFGHE